MLINGLSELEVEAFPQDLPESIVVDISTLIKMAMVSMCATSSYRTKYRYKIRPMR